MQQPFTALAHAACFADTDTTFDCFDISFPLPEPLQCFRGIQMEVLVLLI